MTKYTNKLNKVAQEFQAFNAEQYQLTEEDIITLMGDGEVDGPVLEFYNNPRKDIDVFRVNTILKSKRGCILLIRTPEDTKKNQMKSYYDETIGMQSSTFKHFGDDVFITPWLTAEQWKEIKDALGTTNSIQVFIYGNLNYKYLKMDDTYKASEFEHLKGNPEEYNKVKGKIGKKAILILEKFLARHGAESIGQMDLTEIITYYSTKAFKVIT